MRANPIHLLCLLAALCPAAHSQPDTPPPPLAGIAHVAIRVHDLTASTAFYEKLGFEKAFDLRKDNLPTQVFLKINDHQFLELSQITPQQPAAGFLHLCFEAASLEDLTQEYASRGLIPSSIEKTEAGDLLSTLPGPIQPFGRQKIEFLQYQPDSLHTKDLGLHIDPDRVADRIVAVSLAMNDPDAARDFYINQLNFKPIAGDQMVLHMPGNSGQEVEIVSAAIGTQAHLTMNSDNIGRSARHLHKEGVPVVKNGETLTVTDPDGNTILIEDR